MNPTTLNDVLGDLEDLSRVRRSIAHRLAAFDLEPEVIDDVVLILSELLTNALTHGHAVEAAARVTVDPSGVDLSVRHRRETATDIPGVPSVMPDKDQRSGRGLAVVDALTTQRATVVSADAVAVTCRVARIIGERPFR